MQAEATAAEERAALSELERCLLAREAEQADSWHRLQAQATEAAAIGLEVGHPFEIQPLGVFFCFGCFFLSQAMLHTLLTPSQSSPEPLQCQ